VEQAQADVVLSASHSDLQGWSGSSGGVGNFGLDPQFANDLGCDGVAGTADDDLRLLLGSPCIDAGDSALVLPDWGDVDGDANTAEGVPLDLDSLGRIAGLAIDAGAYEAQGALPSRYCTAKLNSAGCAPHICWIGRPSMTGADGFTLTTSEVLAGMNGLLVWSTMSDNRAFGGGTLCVHNPVYRVPVLNAGGNSGVSDCSGAFVTPFDQAYMLSQGLAAPMHVYAQFLGRDNGYAPPNNFSLTDAVDFEIAP
jgi:hypothetical protein